MANLDLPTAESIIRGAREKSSQLNANFCIAVVDARGDLIAMLREDKSPWRSIFICQGKAAASAAWMRPSSELASIPDSIHQGLMTMLGGRMIPAQGGLPVFSDGEIIGAVGVSGGPPAEDEQVALAGITSVGFQTTA